jgi:CHAD domain-containing protein
MLTGFPRRELSNAAFPDASSLRCYNEWMSFERAGSPNQYGLFRTHLDAFARELPRVEQRHVEAVHGARVASRRLRELVPVLGLDRRTTRKLSRQLRTVTTQLGTVRELDVLMLLIEELERNHRYSPAAVRQVSAVVAQARRAAGERLSDKLPASKLQRLVDRLERAAKRLESDDAMSRRAGGSGPTRAWLWALDARLARRAACGRAAIDAAGTLYSPEYLHKVRIALKKLRYAAELSRDAGGRRIAGDIASLKAAQNLLGRLHDLEVLRAWGREVQATWSPPDLTEWRELGSLVHAVEDDCRQLHARYMRDRATLIGITDRMGASKARVALAGGAAG